MLKKKRRAFEEGHRRKFLVIIDDAPEVESALYYAACRIAHSGGSLLLLYVIEPQEFQHWVRVRDVQIAEETDKAKALFRLNRMRLSQGGFDDIMVEEAIIEGIKADEIVKLIESDEDVSILVLGAASDSKGPGPLVSGLAIGTNAGHFPIPITIVPGDLTLDDIKTLA